MNLVCWRFADLYWLNSLDRCSPRPIGTMRICSLLPSATEMVFALGLADDLVGVSYACDHPEEAASRPLSVRTVVSHSLGGAPGGVGAALAQRRQAFGQRGDRRAGAAGPGQ